MSENTAVGETSGEGRQGTVVRTGGRGPLAVGRFRSMSGQGAHGLIDQIRCGQRRDLTRVVVLWRDLDEVEPDQIHTVQLPDEMDHLAARQAAGFRSARSWSKCRIEHVDVDGHVERADTHGLKDPVHDRLVSLRIDILGGERTFDDGGIARDVVVGAEGATDPHLEYLTASD